MSIRFKIALTIMATGLITALLVIATVVVAFERFEHETTFQRAIAFLARVTASYDNLLELHDRQPQEFNAWLRNLVLYEPDTQLYLLDARGAVLSRTGDAPLSPDYRVSMGPLRAAVAGTTGQRNMPFVMGDDPERMDGDAVIAARPLRRAIIRSDEPVSGYLYVVSHKADLPASRWEAVRNSFALPALVAIASIVALTSLLAWLVIASVTRPLRRLTDAVGRLSGRGLDEVLAETPSPLMPSSRRDEVGRLADAFEMMLTTLRQQWGALRRLDHFRREGVSNLSHDLRSPLTATVACLETLDGRWAGDAQRFDDHRLVEVALRNTRNAARLVQSLGDLAILDEPQFKLTAQLLDVAELLDDIGVRFAERAAQQSVRLRTEGAERGADTGRPALAMLDIELFERAVANLVDNALKFTPAGGSITLGAWVVDGWVQVQVHDTGSGIAQAAVPHLFDRFYQSRHTVAPATGTGGKGLGLAIVKRIAELHGGTVSVCSAPGVGTRVTLSVPTAGG